MTGFGRNALLASSFAFLLGAGEAVAQTPAPPKAGDVRSEAYYNFAMGHMYGELANAYGNRGEYVNKAIDFYKEAIKLDPSSSYVAEELSELYVQVGQYQKAISEAEDLLKQNPNNLNARRILARIYSRMIGGQGDTPGGRVNVEMLKQAVDQYKKIIEADPKDEESLSMLARLYRASQEKDLAEQTYKKLLALDPSSEDALTGLAAVFADRGDLPGAIQMLKKAVEKEPNPRTLVTLAEFYEQLRDYSHAADALKQAIPMAQENEALLKALGRDLFEAGRADEALEVYTELAKTNPKEVEYQVRLTELYTRKKEFAQARAALARAKQLSAALEVRAEEADILDAEEKTPEAIAFLQGLLSETKRENYSDLERQMRLGLLERTAEMQRKAKRTTDAVATFKQISDLDAALSSRVDLMIVETYAQGRDYKQAKSVSDAAIKKFPADRTLLLQHADVLSELGQVDAAVKELNALPNAAKDRGVQTAIAQFYERAKRYNDEKRILDQLESQTQNDADKTPLVFMRGAMYERMKNFDEAEKEFRKVLNADPESAQALNYLGYMLADRGVRLDEAQKMISKAVEMDPENGAYLDSLGWVFFKQGQLDKAVENLRHALDRAGDDPAIHDHLGDTYAKQGKMKEAIAQWEAAVAGYKNARPSERDPEEVSKVTKKLETARVKTAEKGR